MVQYHYIYDIEIMRQSILEIAKTLSTMQTEQLRALALGNSETKQNRLSRSNMIKSIPLPVGFSQTLKLSPQVCPSRRALKNYIAFTQSLTKVTQKL